MTRRLDFGRMNRPYWLYQRVKILHSVESVIFPIDPRFSFLLRTLCEKHPGRAGVCPVSETFLPGAVDIVNEEIAVVGSWPVGKAVEFSTTNTMPTPLTAGTVYYVQAFAGGKIKLSLTYGGAAINLTGIGVGVHTLYAALCPAVQLSITTVSSGEDAHYTPLSPELFTTPGSEGVGFAVESAPYNLDGFGVNMTATPRKISKPLDYLFESGDSVQIKVTGQTVNSSTVAADNLPAYMDLLLVGRYYPQNALPVWKGSH